jgi:hypothetical protein
MQTTKKAAMQRDCLGDAALPIGWAADRRIKGISDDGMSVMS